MILSDTVYYVLHFTVFNKVFVKTMWVYVRLNQILQINKILVTKYTEYSYRNVYFHIYIMML